MSHAYRLRSMGRFGAVTVLAVALTAFGHRSVAAAPIAIQDNYEIVPDSALNVSAPGVLGNDTGNPVEAILVTPPANGSVTLNPDGSFVYAPDLGFNGVDQFVYQTGDGQDLSNLASVFILVNSVPVGVEDSFATPADTPLTVPAPGVVGNDVDPDGGALGASVSDSTNNGTLTLSEADGSFTYAPNPGFEGSDFFAYQPFDGLVYGPGAWVTIVVGDGSAPPVAADDQWSISTGSIGVGVPGILINDIDPDGDPTTAILVDKPSHGAVTLNADGSFFYETEPGFTGTDSFTYQAFDGNDLSNIATVTFFVDHAPVASEDAYQTAVDTPLVVAAPGVLGNDGDADGDPLTAQIFTSASNGTLAFNADGSFTYTPNAGFQGVDVFSYNAYDGVSLSAVTQVVLSVGAGIAPPTAGDDAYAVESDGKLVVPAAAGVLANDADPNGDPLFAYPVDLPAHGTLSLTPDGAFTYEPEAGFAGNDGFTYEVWDEQEKGNVATVTITVGDPPENAPPLAKDDGYQTAQDTALSVAAPGLLGNDDDPDGDPLFVAGYADAAAGGTFAVDSAGGFLFTPEPGFVGTASFAYSVEDGHGAADEGLVTIEVIAAPDSSPAPDPAETAEDGSDADPSPAGSTTSTAPRVTTLPNTGAGPNTTDRGRLAGPWLAGLLLLATLGLFRGARQIALLERVVPGAAGRSLRRRHNGLWRGLPHRSDEDAARASGGRLGSADMGAKDRSDAGRRLTSIASLVMMGARTLP